MSVNVEVAKIVCGKKWVEGELRKQFTVAECEWGPYHAEHEVFLLTVEHDGKKLMEKFSRKQLEDWQGSKKAEGELKKKVSYIIKVFKDVKAFKNLKMEYEKKYEKHLFVSERFAVREFVNKAQSFLGASLCDIKMFGSKIRGTADLDSDIDILLVIESDDWRVRDSISGIAANINMKYDSNISPVIYSRREHEKNRSFGTLFIQETDRKGVPIG